MISCVMQLDANTVTDINKIIISYTAIRDNNNIIYHNMIYGDMLQQQQQHQHQQHQHQHQHKHQHQHQHQQNIIIIIITITLTVV